MINTYKSPKLTLAEDEVFLFGANNQGFHAGGAAGWATSLDLNYNWRTAGYDKLPDGAKGKWNEKGKLGPQVGTEGKSYAIPTVTQAGARRSIPLAEIKKSIDKFYTFAKSRPHLKFFVAQENKTGLNGYSPQEMASIYSGEIPENVHFDSEFAKLLCDHKNMKHTLVESYCPDCQFASKTEEDVPETDFGNISRFVGEIIHCKRGKFSEYIGRPKAGGEWRFGNPFVIGGDGDRGKVISRFFYWLQTGESFGNADATPERREWILRNIHSLKDQTLGCWCDYPKEDCHGRILKEMANGVTMMGEIPENTKNYVGFLPVFDNKEAALEYVGGEEKLIDEIETLS